MGCAARGSECLESKLASLTSEEAAKSAFKAANVTCTGWNGWNYGQGVSQCTEPTCCEGACVGACSVPTTQDCVAKGDDPDHERLCPCDVPPKTTPPPVTPK